MILILQILITKSSESLLSDKENVFKSHSVVNIAKFFKFYFMQDLMYKVWWKYYFHFCSKIQTFDMKIKINLLMQCNFEWEFNKIFPSLRFYLWKDFVFALYRTLGIAWVVHCRRPQLPCYIYWQLPLPCYMYLYNVPTCILFKKVHIQIQSPAMTFMISNV